MKTKANYSELLDEAGVLETNGSIMIASVIMCVSNLICAIGNAIVFVKAKHGSSKV